MTAAVRSDRDDLLAAILVKPEDDGLRLIYADWLRENGQPDRADFIKVQVELARIPLCGGGDVLSGGHCEACRRVVALRRREGALLKDFHPKGQIPNLSNYSRWAGDWQRLTEKGVGWEFCRGFVDSVSLTLAAFLCLRCGGPGRRPFVGGVTHRCEDCGGTGGLARELAARCPLTRVVLTDREPTPMSGGGWGWGPTFGEDAVRFRLPEELWRLLPEIDCNLGNYPTREAADAALSAACVRFARREAGLE